ncbi:MAG: hemerythrin domain-containing protein [Pyrinomonadaceae bacterium]
MDAFELLKADHEKVAKLFDQLESAPGETKLDIFNQIKSELDLHAHIEETILYPVLERPAKTHELTLEAYEEHKVVKTLLAELSGAGSANEEWQAKAKVLRENVEHHVEEEENELFKKADGALSDAEIEALGGRMEAEKARKQGHRAPEQPVAQPPKSSRAGASQPGILTKIADFVGLGEGSGKKTAAKKASANKKSGSKKSSKGGVKAATKKTGGKSSGASATKRSSAAQRTKKTASKRGSKKASGSGAVKKTAKKRAGKK